MTVDDFLSSFSRYESRTAIFSKRNEHSYADLLKFVYQAEEEIVNQGVRSGDIVILASDFHIYGIAYLFGLIKVKAIVVPFVGDGRMLSDRKCILSGASRLFTISAQGFVDCKQVDYVYEHPYFAELRSREVPGLILFTSGTSGDPKAAVHDFSKLLQPFKEKEKSIRTINFLLFDHWGGLNTLFHILSSGGSVVSLSERQPEEVCKAIEMHRVQLLPTSPTFLNLLLFSEAYKRYDLSSLKLITYGTEPMPEATLKKLLSVFPGIKFKQTYGLIELGVLQSNSRSDGSTWVKIGGEGYMIRVVDNMLQIKSDTAMLGYLNADSPFTEDGYFITGDIVQQEGEYFKILGRQSEIINVGGEKVYPVEVESIMRSIDNIMDVVVYSEKNNLTGQIVCAKLRLVKEEDKSKCIKRVRAAARELLESYKVPVKISIVDDELYSERFKLSRTT